MENIALWMSQPHHGYLEIARTLGVKSLVLELEHGTFDLSTLDQFLAYTKALGMPVLTKILAPNAESIQQALDFGSDGVIVPHLLGVEHARAVTRAAKYPLLGVRSYTSGRVFGYARPASDAFDRENARSKCYAMIETAESLADVERIIALDTVDGLFPGPSDLALARGRGAYAFNDADRADLRRIARPRATQALGHARLDRSRTPVRAGGGRVPAGDRDTDDDRARGHRQPHRRRQAGRRRRLSHPTDQTGEPQ